MYHIQLLSWQYPLLLHIDILIEFASSTKYYSIYFYFIFLHIAEKYFHLWTALKKSVGNTYLPKLKKTLLI